MNCLIGAKEAGLGHADPYHDISQMQQSLGKDGRPASRVNRIFIYLAGEIVIFSRFRQFLFMIYKSFLLNAISTCGIIE